MIKRLKKLSKLFPVSKKQYFDTINAIRTVIDGLIESEANQSQMQMSILQQLQQKEEEKQEKKDTPNTNNKNMYG